MKIQDRDKFPTIESHARVKHDAPDQEAGFQKIPVGLEQKHVKESVMFRNKRWIVVLWFFLMCSVMSLTAQQTAIVAANAVVPPVVKYSGVLNDADAKPMTGVVGVTFALYKDQEGGAPLWMEMQNVRPDKSGHYTVTLGSSNSKGLTSDVFANGEARWLGVQAQGEAEQPRTLLMSVPYALKAADAETIGGLPPSAFLKANGPGAQSGVNGVQAPAGLSGSGTANHVTKWVGTTTLGNSNIFDGPSGNVGIAINSPAARLDVNGTALIRSNATVEGALNANSVSSGTVSASSSGGAISASMSGAQNNVAAVTGSATASGDSGFTFGVWGLSSSNQGRGVVGQVSGSSVVGVIGEVASGGAGIGVQGKALPGSSGMGVWGESDASAGSGGFGPDGVDGISHSASGSGVFAYNDSTGDALAANNQTGGYAGFFLGDVDVDGNLSKAGGSFKIDDPIDPANKYLYHSFVESPDMMNIYNGNVITDGSGNAVVSLPEWFENLNRDFRYQLTVLGQFAQAIVSSKVSNHQFAIKTDKPNVEVSWQVTGIRQDAWANAHRIPVEVQKPEQDRGMYLHPELFGQSMEKSIALAHHPSMRMAQKHKSAVTEKH